MTIKLGSDYCKHSVDAAAAGVLSELDGMFALEEDQRTKAETFLRGKKAFSITAHHRPVTKVTPRTKGSCRYLAQLAANKQNETIFFSKWASPVFSQSSVPDGHEQ